VRIPNHEFLLLGLAILPRKKREEKHQMGCSAAR